MDGRKRKFIKELLTKPKLRREAGLFVVDGAKMCGELLSEEVEELFVTPSFLGSAYETDCEAVLRRFGYTEVTEQEMKQMSDTVSPQGILALVKMRQVRGIGALLHRSEDTPFLLILETIQDPGNLGTILRAAEAAGVTAVLADQKGVDLYSPKVVRSTMGAVFRVPYLAVEDLPKAVTALREGLYTEGEPLTVYAAHLGASVPYDSVSYRGACGVMIGNESKGLSGALTEKADQMIHIPMCGRVESLNAAMAAAIIAFEGSRQRRNAD